jgi:hypothetical protein
MKGTVWQAGLFGEPPDRYAILYRGVLPALDIALLYSGIAAVRVGSPALTDFTQGGTAALIWGAGMTIASLLCLVGVAFPRLLVLEAIGKAAAVAGLAIFLLVLVVLTGQGSDGRALVAGVSFGAFLICLWRLGDIRKDLRVKRRKREAAEHETAAE